jgi:hypothetical protein
VKQPAVLGRKVNSVLDVVDQQRLGRVGQVHAAHGHSDDLGPAAFAAAALVA